jgi:hypothetical protein
MILLKQESEFVKPFGLVFTALAVSLLACGTAFATPPAPAPLLAAGIPAFAALGGGAAVTTLLRRFRRRK